MKKQTSICPKCGYDQSGEIATWKDQCPLEGRCPECGYEFAWAYVLNSSRIKLNWYVEHGETLFNLTKQTVPTLWYLLVPNRYWNRVTMEVPRSIKQYLTWLISVMLVVHVFVSVCYMLTQYLITLDNNAQWQAYLNGLDPVQRAMVPQVIVDVYSLEYWWPLIGESLLTPIVLGNYFYTNDAAEIFLLMAMVCSGGSIAWFLLFCAFPTTRARSKLRIVHVVRAMIIGGTLPILMVELGRFLALLAYIGEYYSPLAWVDGVVAITLAIGSVGMLIWVQWFWISAVRVGWKVKANYGELFLVMIASFIGLVFTGLLMLFLGTIASVIQFLASHAGIL